jgi:hypothetical protein
MKTFIGLVILFAITMVNIAPASANTPRFVTHGYYPRNLTINSFKRLPTHYFPKVTTKRYYPH